MAEKPQESRKGVRGGVRSPQGTNTPEVAELPQGDETLRVTTAVKGVLEEDGRGQGGDNPPPPPHEQRRRKETAAAPKSVWGDQGMRRRRAHSGVWRWTTASRGPLLGIPPAPTATGPSTARSHTASTAYWRQQGRRSIWPTQVTLGARMAMRPQGVRPARPNGRRRRGETPGITRSQQAVCEEPIARDGDPPNGRPRLTCAAAKGGKAGEFPPPSSARSRLAARDRRGTPKHSSARH